jgi:beta-1,4-mannosyl-glycoprotein beta-1,4-N-acetylglucosaminyltransferase
LGRGERAKIFDCFLFFNEVEALSIRFHELDDVVDYHVIVEGTTTFSGRPRRPGFDLNDPRWSPFREKVIHVVVEDTPEHAGVWEREQFQRNAILRGLDRYQPDRLGPVCGPQDLVLISDADEIPSASAVRWVADHLVRGVAAFERTLYYYHLNQLICQPNVIGADSGPVPSPWYYARAAHRAEIDWPQAVRELPLDACALHVANGGWHFSYLGGVSRIQAKIDAFSHQELNLPQYTDATNIVGAIESGRDLFGRKDLYEFHVVPIDARFPRFVLENHETLASIINPLGLPTGASTGAVDASPNPIGESPGIAGDEAGHDPVPDAGRSLASARLAGARDEPTNLQAEYEARRSVRSDIVDHLPTLYETVCRYPGARVLELGVRSGTSTSALLAAVDAVDGHLWSMDVIPPQVPAWWADTARWTLTIGDDLGQDVMNAAPAEVDVLFVDTSHAYEHTLAELRTYVPRVRAGGVVMCHDTELEVPAGVGASPPFPVAKALDTFCAETGRSWVNRPGCYGLGVIEISATENRTPPETARRVRSQGSTDPLKVERQ